MDTFEIIKKRRSIRKFRNLTVPYDKLEKLVESARLAPSVMNLQPLEYIIVENAQLVKEVFDCTEWKNYVFESGPKKGEEPKTYIVVLIKNAELKHAEFDAGLATENILLAAQNEGIASCCLGAVEWTRINRILKIPTEYYAKMLIALGYPKQEATYTDAEDKKIRSVNGKIIVSKEPLSKILHKNYF
jgi:nitroreductase